MFTFHALYTTWVMSTIPYMHRFCYYAYVFQEAATDSLYIVISVMLVISSASADCDWKENEMTSGSSLQLVEKKKKEAKRVPWQIRKYFAVKVDVIT